MRWEGGKRADRAVRVSDDTRSSFWYRCIVGCDAPLHLIQAGSYCLGCRRRTHWRIVMASVNHRRDGGPELIKCACAGLSSKGCGIRAICSDDSAVWQAGSVIPRYTIAGSGTVELLMSSSLPCPQTGMEHLGWYGMGGKMPRGQTIRRERGHVLLVDRHPGQCRPRSLPTRDHLARVSRQAV